MNFFHKVRNWLLYRPTPEPSDFGGAGATGAWHVSLAAMKAAAPTADDETLYRYLEPLNVTCEEFDIRTPRRVAAFLAQVAHESGGFRYVREIASGAAYEGRLDLGNTEPGDGVRFAGRGLIQLTGRANYHAASEALCGDARLVLAPLLLERPDLAARVSGWYWQTHGCNELADQDRFVDITRRINGGLNGFADRAERWKRVRAEMGVTA